MKQTFKVSGAGKGEVRINFADNNLYWYYQVIVGSGILSKRLKDSGIRTFNLEQIRSNKFVPGAIINILEGTLIVHEDCCMMDSDDVSGKFYLDLTGEFALIKSADLQAKYFKFKLEAV